MQNSSLQRTPSLPWSLRALHYEVKSKFECMILDAESRFFCEPIKSFASQSIIRSSKVGR